MAHIDAKERIIVIIRELKEIQKHLLNDDKEAALEKVKTMIDGYEVTITN
jgi:hypothetical protein